MISRQLAAEGVKRIVVVTDEPEKYRRHYRACAPACRSQHRDDLDARPARAARGQGHRRPDLRPDLRRREAPPAQARRRCPDPPKRVFINELVCEGCGDCSTKSNCLSVVPVETEFGRKRADRPVLLQQGLLLRQGLLPELRHRPGRQLRKPKPAAGGQSAVAESRCRSPPCPASTSPTASWSPASAAPAS